MSLFPHELATSVRQLRGFAAARRRDPAAITISFKAPLRLEGGGSPSDSPSRTLLSGSPSQVIEDLRAYVDAGVEHFVFDFTVPTAPAMLDVMERFAAEVRPHARW